MSNPVLPKNPNPNGKNFVPGYEMPVHVNHVAVANEVYAGRVQGVEFAHDISYFKHEIWGPCEIMKKFGHDPATYPDQDLVAHYATVQFKGTVCDPKPQPKPEPKPSPDVIVRIHECPAGQHFDGTLCVADQVEEAAAEAVEALAEGLGVQA